MKKIVILFAAFILLFASSCEKQETKLAFYEDTYTSTTENQSINETISTNVPPYKVSTYWSNLKQIKIAAESMEETEFYEYMDTYFSNEKMNGMRTPDITNEMLEEIESSYIATLDGKHEDSWLSFRADYHYIFYQVLVDDDFGFKFSVYTLPGAERLYNASDYFEQAGTYTVGGATINLFRSLSDESESLCGNICIDGQYTTFITTQNIDIEKFETVLPRLSFIKAEDLLNEINAEATQPENNSETTLTTEETTQESTEITEVIETAA